MLPIPKSWLIHTATHSTQTSTAWGAETASEAQTLTFVRIESSNKLLWSKDNAEKRLTALMFYDCTNSKPKDIVFSEGDTIIFGIKTYKVETVELLSAEKPHHYELGLTG